MYYGQAQTDKVIEDYFDAGYIGNCIEVGAVDGVRWSNTKHFEDLGWNCICIEPNPKFNLEQQRKHGIICAAGKENIESAPFTVFSLPVNNESAISSLQVNEECFKSHEHLIQKKRIINVQVRTLDSILQENSWFVKLDFITIDTEGTELNVLKGFDINRWKPKLIVIETNCFETIIKNYLSSFGYVLDRRYDADTFYIRRPIPQIDVRLKVGPYQDETLYLAYGKIDFDRLVNAGLKTTDSVLDLGCGCGRIAIHFIDFLKGNYAGFDNINAFIDWNQKNISSKYPNFEFKYVDVYSGHYNKTGSVQASTFKFPYPSEQFNFVFAASLFTHMFLDDIEAYLKEVSRVLKKNGIFYATYFLLHNEIKQGGLKDERMIAHQKDVILKLYEKFGFFIQSISYGNWSFSTPGLDPYQDTVIVRKI